LPVNGRLSGPGIAIRDGFLSAYMNDNDNPDRPAVRIYDTGSNDAADLYRQAIEDGVNFIVGPLSKKNVQSLVENKLTGISTLALNYLPDELLPGASLYQFSLAPEHESAEVARRALTNGFTRGVVLLPDSDWGQRMLQSFGETFEAGGGVVLDFNMYDPKEKDFSGPITDLLNLNSSKHRHRAISAVVGTSLEFEPRRRQDTEFVFLAANAKQGQLLRPQLNYHYANDLPVLSTSAIFNDDSTQNSRDLDGVIFADAPWMISDDPEIRTSRQTLNQFWPGRMKRRSRLYAMGIDAYHLIPLLFGQRQPLDTAWPGMTGMLTMEPGNRIVRTLDIAEIRNGEAVYLPASDADLDSSAVSAEDAAP